MDVREKASNGRRLIDLSTLGIGERNPNAFNDPERAYGWNDLLKILETAPTVDAVQVVRCRDCQHWKPSGSKAGNSFSNMEYIGGCEFTNYYRRESDFCSYGERKEGAD